MVILDCDGNCDGEGEGHGADKDDDDYYDAENDGTDDYELRSLFPPWCKMFCQIA